MNSPPVSSGDDARLAALCSFASAAILTLMCTLVLLGGGSQQTFEVFAPPERYAQGLVAGAMALRRILFFDDLFITAYVTSTVLFVRWLASRFGPSPLHRIVLIAAVTGGALDLLENHHILAMIRTSELGILPSAGEIEAQMVASCTKWILGHIAFAMIGITLPARTPFLRAFRFSLVAMQLPMGVLAWTQTSAELGTVLGGPAI
jgi:hypothetical protein